MHVLGIIISVIIVSGMLISLGLVIYKNILKIKKQKLEIKEKENKKGGDK
ncbi:hypothetical protein [Spiroplasma endosymbiont of Colias croceus]